MKFKLSLTTASLLSIVPLALQISYANTLISLYRKPSGLCIELVQKRGWLKALSRFSSETTEVTSEIKKEWIQVKADGLKICSDCTSGLESSSFKVNQSLLVWVKAKFTSTGKNHWLYWLRPLQTSLISFRFLSFPNPKGSK